MKKLSKYLLAGLMTFSLMGCSSKQNSSLKVLCPLGAPALAFASEYEKINKDGQIDLVDGSDQLVAELSKSNSDYDIIVAPINLGAKLISDKQTDYRIQGVVTWGNLYLVGTSKEALNETGELALFGENSVPQKIIDTASLDTSLTYNYYQSPTLVQQQLLAGNVHVGMLAEPLASATIAKAKQNNIELSIITDLQTAYGDNGYPQAALFVKDGKDYSEILDEIDEFTNNGYKDLSSYLETIGIDNLGLPSVELAVKSIERQNIHYKDSKDCKKDIKDFLKLFNIEYSDDLLN